MITITLDHSYEDNYWMIADIEIELIDEKEKMRILKEFKKIEQTLVDPDRDLKSLIAESLDVEESFIDLDTNELDIM